MRVQESRLDVSIRVYTTNLYPIFLFSVKKKSTIPSMNNFYPLLDTSISCPTLKVGKFSGEGDLTGMSLNEERSLFTPSLGKMVKVHTTIVGGGYLVVY